MAQQCGNFIPAALAEIRRVLRPGGRVWLTLHTIGIPLDLFRRGNIRGKIFASYVILNGFALHFTGRTFAFPNGRRESFQTRRGIEAALRRAGFTEIGFPPTDRHFVVRATR